VSRTTMTLTFDLIRKLNKLKERQQFLVS